MAGQTWIDAEVDATVSMMRKELGGTKPGTLSMAGLEAILVGIATKVVVGVIVGLINKALFDAWSQSKSKDEIQQLRDQILAMKSPLKGLDDESLRKAMEAELIQQGVPAEQVSHIASAVIQNVRKSLPLPLQPVC